MAEWRELLSFDVSMNAWYNFVDYGIGRAEFFKASPGMLLWYRTTEFSDNHVGVHPWQGCLLIVDSKPKLINALGTEPLAKELCGVKAPLPVRTRIQIYDATFGVRNSTSGKLTSYFGNPAYITLPPTKQVATFADRIGYVDRTCESYLPTDWYGFLIYAISSVDTPTYGVKIQVKQHYTGNRGGLIRVDFSKPKNIPSF